MDDGRIIAGPWAGAKELQGDLRTFVNCVTQLWEIDPSLIAVALVEASKDSDRAGLEIELAHTRIRSIMRNIEAAHASLTGGVVAPKRSTIERIMMKRGPTTVETVPDVS